MIWTWSDADLARLTSFLQDRDLCSGPLTVRPVGDGHANLTYMVTDGASAVVVRRPPPPPTPPGANDMLREARIQRALAATAVPVPRVLAVAEAGEVLDVPMYVMSLIDGVVVTARTPPQLAMPDQRRAIAESLIDTLSALHAVDWRALGLEGFGRPEGFNERHVRRIARLVADENGRMPAAFLPLMEWLEANIPTESGAAILHSDYRLGNVMLARDRPGRVLAVLDWELATLGDPLLDVGYFFACYPVPGHPLTPTAELSAALLEPGFPSRQELADRYTRATGRNETDLRWYTAMALWKLAALFEHSHRRAIAGVGDRYYADARLVSRFLAAGKRETELNHVF